MTAADALALEPDDATSHGLAGYAALLSGDTAEALARYREAVRREPLDEHHRAGELSGLSIGLRARNPFYAALLRLTEWQERQGGAVQKLGLVGPAVAVGLIRVSGLAETALGLVLIGIVVAVLALSWAIEPITNALFLTGKEGRMLLDPREARSAKLFTLALVVAVALALLGANASPPRRQPPSSARSASHILSLGLGASHQVEDHPLLRFFYIGCAAAGICAVAATACALVGADGVLLAIPVLFAGIASLWFVRLRA